MIEYVNPFKHGSGHNNPFKHDGEMEADELALHFQSKGAMMRATTNDALKSKSQLLVELLMAKMNSKQQAIPTCPTIPSDEVCRLRASLILEEALETIHALGVEVTVGGQPVNGMPNFNERVVDIKSLAFRNVAKPDLIEIADGLGDLDVVGPCGTASACGIAMEPIKAAIDANNLLKFAPGHSFREDGKLIKPANHPDVHDEIRRLLIEQGADESMLRQLL